jgi:4-alpha-glucanotransferase
MKLPQQEMTNNPSHVDHNFWRVRIVFQVHQIFLNFKIGRMRVVHEGGAMEKRRKGKVFEHYWLS